MPSPEYPDGLDLFREQSTSPPSYSFRPNSFMMSGEGDVAARQKDTDAAVVRDTGVRFRDARNAGTVSVLIDDLGRKPDDSVGA
jgi:hypothetical protein